MGKFEIIWRDVARGSCEEMQTQTSASTGVLEVSHFRRPSPCGLRPECNAITVAIKSPVDKQRTPTKKKKHRHNKHDVQRKQRLKQQHNKQKQQQVPKQQQRGPGR